MVLPAALSISVSASRRPGRGRGDGAQRPSCRRPSSRRARSSGRPEPRRASALVRRSPGATGRRPCCPFIPPSVLARAGTCTGPHQCAIGSMLPKLAASMVETGNRLKRPPVPTFPFPRSSIAVLAGLVCGMFALVTFVEPEPREMEHRAALKPAGRNERLRRRVSAFLDMLASERGAAAQHARSLSARPRGLSRLPRRQGGIAPAAAERRLCAAYLAPRRARPQGLLGGAPPLRRAAIPQVPLRRGLCGADPTAAVEGAEARPARCRRSCRSRRSTASSPPPPRA